MTDWQPIETAPVSGDVLLSYQTISGKRLVAVGFFIEREGVKLAVVGGNVFSSWCAKVLAWMPLPDPPKETVE